MAERIAFLTSKDFKELTASDKLLCEDFVSRGHEVKALVWNSPELQVAEAFDSYSSIVFRSIWDYHLKIDNFQLFLDRLGDYKGRIINPLSAIKWNYDKSYLLELQQKGVATVPSFLVFQDDDEPTLSELVKKTGWANFVFKPTIGASAYEVYHVQKGSDLAKVEEDLHTLQLEGDILVQPFIEEIVTDGEYSLVFFGKNFSHGVLKQPKEGDFRVQQEFGGKVNAFKPASKIIDWAMDVIEKAQGCFSDEVFYCRVDYVLIENKPFLMELELIEPELYFEHSRNSTSNFLL